MKIPEAVRPFVCPAWKPIVEDGDSELTASKFSGTPVVLAGENWPRCPNCEQCMQLFVQLASSDLPEGAPRFGDGLLQLFYCTSSDPLCEVDCEAYFPFASSVLGRVVDPAASEAPASRPEEPLPAKRIVGWKRCDDYPHWEELEPKGVALSDREIDALWEHFPVTGDKLGGWPAWVQGVEYPDCTTCGRVMELRFQIDSEDNLPYMFGDVGTGHLFQCAEHTDVLSFHWACH